MYNVIYTHANIIMVVCTKIDHNETSTCYDIILYKNKIKHNETSTGAVHYGSIFNFIPLLWALSLKIFIVSRLMFLVDRNLQWRIQQLVNTVQAEVQPVRSDH